MKAAVFRGPGRIAVEEMPSPELTPDSAILKVEACGICGSDLRTYSSGMRIDRPWQILGHEVAGTVIAVGANVTGLRVGQPLAIAADVSCGECWYCKRALFNLCDRHQILGTHFAGGLAEQLWLSPEILARGIYHPIPTGVSFVAAAMAEPASSVIASQEQAAIQLGDTVAIIGAGPIGCLHVEVARARGARTIMVERNAPRLAFAREMGAEHAIDASQEDPVALARELTGGLGVDVAIVAAPSAQAQEQAVRMVRKRGTVVLFGGLPKSDPMTHLDGNIIHYGELRVIGAFSYHPSHHAKALDYIGRGLIRAERYITRFSLPQVVEAFTAAKSGSAIKVIITPT